MTDFYAPNPDKDYLLITVQRTGTRFLQRILSAAKIKTAQIHPVKTRVKQIDGWLQLNNCHDLPIIVSLRHPFLVCQSWMLRAERREPEQFQIDAMFDQWEYLNRIISESKPLFVPVDHANRQGYLDELGDYLVCSLETDWQKYGHKPGAEKMSIPAWAADQLNELIATTFLSEFYSEVPHGT